METTIQDVEEVVNRLIEACREGQQGFQAAANAVQNPRVRPELEHYSRQSGNFAEALADALREAGYIPTEYASIPGVLRRGWMNLNGTVGETLQTIVSVCEHGEEAARQAYFEAMTEPLPPRLKQLITEQYRSIEAVHERIRVLRESASAGEAAAQTQKETQGKGIAK